MKQTKASGDFSKGSIPLHIAKLAVPMIFAQFVQLAYNLVDRIYIGHMPGESQYALTGLGLTFPIILIVAAFTNLFSTGGAPLFSIARGNRDQERAGRIFDNTLFSLVFTSILLMAAGYLAMRPLLTLLGASDHTLPFALSYLSVYLIGTPFIMVSSGLNPFINAQGYGVTAMVTVLSGAILNIALDPLFIYEMDLGIRGAALASVLSQFLSAIWVILFFAGKRSARRITVSVLHPDFQLILQIAKLGTAGFIVQATNGLVQITANLVLKETGGDLYIGVMTLISTARDFVMLPVQGLTDAGRPVVGYNYGARAYQRVWKGIFFLSAAGLVMMLILWIFLLSFPRPFLMLFTSDPSLIQASLYPMYLYFFAIFMMGFQFTGQTVFTGLGFSKQAIFFSLLRKVFIVIPLTLLLPKIPSLSVYGVFLAEPVSNCAGGLACYLTMLAIMKKHLGKPDIHQKG